MKSINETSKKIKTLVSDIYETVTRGFSPTPESVKTFSERLAERISNKVGDRSDKSNLRLSNIGTPCSRKLWYGINSPEKGEELPPQARLKFLFGDILEELLLWLARESGHTVTDEQSEVRINDVVGHIDGLVDGELVDCKSASTYSFQKFKDHGLAFDDPFGYLHQLGAYGSRIGVGSNHFLAIDKTLGHIHLDTWPKSKVNYEVLINQKKKILENSSPPEREFSDEEMGAGGNRRLGVACSYCSFKHTCWPGLRTFLYASGPVYLTVVKKRPQEHVKEV